MIKDIPMPNTFAMTEEESDAWYNDGRAIIGTRNAYSALESIDDLLKPFGLQIGLYDNGASDYLVSVVPGTEGALPTSEMSHILNAHQSEIARLKTQNLEQIAMVRRSLEQAKTAMRTMRENSPERMLQIIRVDTLQGLYNGLANR